MTEYRPRRSALYMPGANARALEKAKDLPADVLILDLEDAVAPAAKADARALVAEAVKSRAYGDREVVVRVNGFGTDWHGDDIVMVREAQPDAVLLPKVNRPDDVKIPIDQVPVWVMIETPLGVLNAASIAASKAAALIIGANDLAKDLRAPLAPGRDALRVALQTTVLAARAHGKAALDGVWNDLGDAEGLAAECRDGAALGFDGKTLIHPGQIEAANAAFSPSEEEIAQARAVIAAFAAQPDAGVLKVNGRMTERLHLAEAERIAALADSR